jgi:hypothetical protein
MDLLTTLNNRVMERFSPFTKQRELKSNGFSNYYRLKVLIFQFVCFKTRFLVF